MDQPPTARLLTLLTFRPEFRPPWGSRSHLTQLTLTRLTQRQVEEMVLRMTGDKPLPAEVVRQIVAKTDGVPLFVEELTKVVLESDWLRDCTDHYELLGPLPALAIPTTLQDSLMARLDRLATAKTVAQLGAIMGRQFTYELIQAVSSLDEATLQRELGRLVEAELLYQQGVPPQATYMFKHALLQDAAYQSLLRSTRQEYHQWTAQVLEARFPETVATQPELLAQHYTAAELPAQAIPYWLRAGQRASERSAYPEAVQHLMTGLALLTTLPETLGRAQQELDLQIALGPTFMATKGMTAPETEQTYARARALCTQIGDTPRLFSALRGSYWFYHNCGAFQTALELGEQLDRLAQRQNAPTPRLEAHEALGTTLFLLGDYATARARLEQGLALSDATAQRAQALRHGIAPGMACLALAANTLWCLGFPTQAVRRSQEALAQAQVLVHPYSLAYAQYFAAVLHHRRRETSAVQIQAEALLSLATAQGFPVWVGLATCLRGWALAMQGQSEAGLVQIYQGLAGFLATRHELSRPFCLVLLAEVASHVGQVTEGLRLLAEALTVFEASKRGDLLTEVYRLQGELLLRQAVPEVAQAEACFQQALTIARRQQAKSWELRAAMSLSRLWQQQGQRAEARELLAPIYGWFTEGFDTADLQEARALLEASR